jgi:hypothetical protein
MYRIKKMLQPYDFVSIMVYHYIIDEIDGCRAWDYHYKVKIIIIWSWITLSKYKNNTSPGYKGHIA